MSGQGLMWMLDSQFVEMIMEQKQKKRKHDK